MSSNLVLGAAASDNSQDASEVSQASGPEYLGLRPSLQETGALSQPLAQSPGCCGLPVPRREGQRRRLEELQELVLERELRRIELEEKKLVVETQKLHMETENLELEKQKLQLQIGELQSNLRHSRNPSVR
ncbi:unnamed protein product [Ixodes pacificus]